MSHPRCIWLRRNTGLFGLYGDTKWRYKVVQYMPQPLKHPKTHVYYYRKVVYRNAAHMISLEHPKEFVREVTAFAQTASDSR